MMSCNVPEQRPQMFSSNDQKTHLILLFLEKVKENNGNLIDGYKGRLKCAMPKTSS